MPLADNKMFWNVEVKAFRYGMRDFVDVHPAAWKFGGYSVATLDTGTTLMYIPGRLHYYLRQAMFHNMQYTIN